MKKIVLAMALAVICFSSCRKQENQVLTCAVVTVKDLNDQTCGLRLDEETMILPTNLTTNPFKKEVRALTYYYDKGETTAPEGSALKWRKAEIQKIDSILTKKFIQGVSREADSLAYGRDPIEIYNSWVTVVEDGYITIHFCGKWGTSAIAHKINLLRSEDPNKPYEFELHHGYNGDMAEDGYFSNGIVAFNIKDVIDGGKTTYPIKINYRAHGNLEKSVTFQYTPGESALISTGGSSTSSYTVY